MVRVLNESGFYLSAGCIFFIFCLLAISKIKNAVLRRKKWSNQKIVKINWPWISILHKKITIPISIYNFSKFTGPYNPWLPYILNYKTRVLFSSFFDRGAGTKRERVVFECGYYTSAYERIADTHIAEPTTKLTWFLFPTAIHYLLTTVD